MHRVWVNASGGYIAFPDTKTSAPMRLIGPAVLAVIDAQAEVAGNPRVFPASFGTGAYTAAADCLTRVCRAAGLTDVTPHPLGPTFGSTPGELAFSELTIRAMLGHASHSVTQDYIHIDKAVKMAVR